MMQIKRDYHLRKQDEQKLDELSKADPQAVLSEKRPQFTPEYLSIIGIDYQSKVLGKGFLKRYWHDFIVEEITRDFNIISIENTTEQHPQEQNLEKPKTEADLVKQGMPTIEAIERLAEKLNIDTNQINYAGMKDSSALTSQQISFNGLRPERLQNLQIPNLFLKNIHERKGVVEMGKLYGNRFTILIRTAPGEIEITKVNEMTERLNKSGFYNFYSLQRFGPRLLAHKLGGRILRGEYEEAAKMFLVGDSPHEMNAFRKIRKEALAQWGNWSEMAKIFQQFPYFLYYELLFLESLQKNPDFIAAFAAISDQTKIFVYAYFSYWFNKLLSQKINQNNVTETLPLLREAPETKAPYQNLIPQDQLNKIKFFHKGLEWLTLNRHQDVKTKIVPKIWHVNQVESGLIFHFDLEKGAYATTMLAEMFHLFQGKPFPDWVNPEEFDIKQLIGYQPLFETLNHFPKADTTADIGLME